MGNKVIVIGGGVAGMSAAHELIERGFEVEVYEKQKIYVGGKARSVDVPEDVFPSHPNKPLPGEHGFRFFPGFYRHVTDTMKRIPQKIEDGKYSKETCFDNLVETENIMICRPENMESIVFPTDFLGCWANLKTVIKLFLHPKTFRLEKGERWCFIKKMLTLMGSCEDRRNGQYEGICWWDFMEAASKSDSYQKLMVIGVTRTLVAADATRASTKTDGNIILQLLYDFLDPTIRTDRVFNQPTNEAWLTPWYNYLLNKGVKYHKSHEFKGFDLDPDKKTIAAAKFKKNGSLPEINRSADYYILAIPADRAAETTQNLMPLDDCFSGLQPIKANMRWMTGIQFYLNKEVSINSGHVNYAYSPWSLTSIDQMNYWKNYDLSSRGNGKVKSILSVDISNWTTAGPEHHIAANLTDYRELANDVWTQLKDSINKPGQTILEDNMREGFYLDSDIITQEQRMLEMGTANVARTDPKNYNQESMVVNTINSWKDRPEAITRIPNLFLAADYVKTNTDLATMEAANEAARKAVNGIIDASGSDVAKCTIWHLAEPALCNPVKWYDQIRYRRNNNSTFRAPWWLKLIMVPWAIIYFIYFFAKILVFRLRAKRVE